jgi:hypothetical protein
MTDTNPKHPRIVGSNIDQAPQTLVVFDLAAALAKEPESIPIAGQPGRGR